MHFSADFSGGAGKSVNGYDLHLKGGHIILNDVTVKSNHMTGSRHLHAKAQQTLQRFSNFFGTTFSLYMRERKTAGFLFKLFVGISSCSLVIHVISGFSFKGEIKVYIF